MIQYGKSIDYDLTPYIEIYSRHIVNKIDKSIIGWSVAYLQTMSGTLL